MTAKVSPSDNSAKFIFETPHMNLLVSFSDATKGFSSGADSPREYLERSIERLESREPTLHAFAALSLEKARIAADHATRRWRQGTQRSPLDGMPVGIKDVIETLDMPTGMGCAAISGPPTRDAASVLALRALGAAIIGKTTTTEFAGAYPNQTRNPHDITRTSGGSSSGSGCAVGAGVLPAALGTQVVGSIIRPASYCGAYGFKPTFGALNRGGCHDIQSHSCLGVIGASLTDMWLTAREIAAQVGGDPGQPSLAGPRLTPEAVAPTRLAFIETPGWQKASDESRTNFEALVKTLETLGTVIVSRQNSNEICAMEAELVDSMSVALDIGCYEMRWLIKSVAQTDPSSISLMASDRAHRGDSLSPEYYQSRLERRRSIRQAFSTAASQVDAFITLSATGCAPLGTSTTGDPAFNVMASLLGAPAISLPLLRDGGLPLGVQLVGAKHTDQKLFSIAGAIVQTFQDPHR